MRGELKDEGSVTGAARSDVMLPRLTWGRMLLFSDGKSQAFAIILHYFMVQPEAQALERGSREIILGLYFIPEYFHLDGLEG